MDKGAIAIIALLVGVVLGVFGGALVIHPTTIVTATSTSMLLSTTISTVTTTLVGSTTLTNTTTKTVQPTELNAKLTIYIVTPDPKVGVPVEFVVSGCSDCIYTWDFGNGATGSGTSANVTNIFVPAGTYQVTVNGQSVLPVLFSGTGSTQLFVSN